MKIKLKTWELFFDSGILYTVSARAIWALSQICYGLGIKCSEYMHANPVIEIEFDPQDETFVKRLITMSIIAQEREEARQAG